MDPKPVFWMGSTLRDLRDMPRAVRQVMGQALDDAQRGGRHPDAKPLKGFGGAQVLEIVDRDADGTYRGVYTTMFAGTIYVLHVFQKKSKQGIMTPRSDIDLIRSRLRLAELHHRSTAKGS